MSDEDLRILAPLQGEDLLDAKLRQVYLNKNSESCGNKYIFSFLDLTNIREIIPTIPLPESLYTNNQYPTTSVIS